MSLNEEVIQPNSDSFWEINNYKRTVKRHEDGQRLCTELMTLIQERADVEKHYAKALKQWSKKWNDILDKGPEYGTTLGACKGFLVEADELSEIHLTIKKNLIEGVKGDIQMWKNENYKKAMMGPSKETKDLEDQFKKAQKPWSKSYNKGMESRKKYHLACKQERSAVNQENNAKSDSAISQDNLKKLQDKVEKSRRDVEVTHEKYEDALTDLNSRNSRYMEDMTEAFDKSQAYEEKRLNFFKEMLYGIHKCLDISNTVRIQQIYAQLNHTIDQADYEKDLKFWSINHGTEMGMNWPNFEEYSPELNTISRKEKKTAVTGHNEGITLTSIHNKETYRGDIAQPVPVQDAYTTQNNTTPAPVAAAAVVPQSNGPSANPQNPFGDTEWEDYDMGAAHSDGNIGVTVRALYDYEAKEDDELSFRVGDIFIQLESRDDQGWCKGKKDGNIGLFPDNYTEVIQ